MLTIRGYLFRSTIPLAALAFVACSNDNKGTPAEEEGTPTGATCPTGSTVTYDGFVKGFMEGYCTRCHDSKKSGDARNDAPLGHDFDTEEGILLVADHVDEHAGSGPNATNELMPPSSPTPPVEDRKKLSEWIACNAEPDAGAH
jgi:uncharacterized membrane protein